MTHPLAGNNSWIVVCSRAYIVDWYSTADALAQLGVYGLILTRSQFFFEPIVFDRSGGPVLVVQSVEREGFRFALATRY